MCSLNRIELLSLIKKYNKENVDKIKNIDKLKKEELYEICCKYHLIKTEVIEEVIMPIDLHTINKNELLKDIQIYFCYKGMNVPDEISKMKKDELITFMEDNSVKHYTPELIKKEVLELEKNKKIEDIIVYNVMRYDNLDMVNLKHLDHEQYIIDKKLNTNTDDIDDYIVLINRLYTAYVSFCVHTNRKYEFKKYKSLPFILEKINELI